MVTNNGRPSGTRTDQEILERLEDPPALRMDWLGVERMDLISGLSY